MRTLSVTQPNFIFFGTRSIFSRVVLQHLLRGKHVIRAIIVPNQTTREWHQIPPPAAVQSELMMVPSFVNQTIVEIGWDHGIPVWNAPSRAKQVPFLFKESAPTAILVACWPSRLPTRLLKWPTWGALNVHPSLLPHYRGPVPLFWQRRAGLSESGVTIHLMSKRLDEGNLLAQATYTLPDGLSGQELDYLAAQKGAILLNKTINGLLKQAIHPLPQPKSGHYDSWPTEDAFIVPITWSARHAYNFIQAANEWHQPFTINFASGSIKIKRAFGFTLFGTLDMPVVRHDDHVAIQFTPGILNAELASL